MTRRLRRLEPLDPEVVHINDTTADLALVMLGGFVVVWLGVIYRGDPADSG